MKFLVANAIVPFFSDISIQVMVSRSVPLFEAIWMHRISIMYLIAICIAIILLVFRVKYANYVAFAVFSILLFDYYFIMEHGVPAQGAPIIERLEYNDPEFGAQVEKMWSMIFPVLEILLISGLVISSHIRRHFNVTNA